LGKAVYKELGCPVLLWDLTLGAEYDLTKRCNQHKILHWMTKGYIKAGHLGTPCNSFSRARDQPGGPPPLRSDEKPLGLEGLKAHDAHKVRVGNALMYFSCRILSMALYLHIAFTLENPARSRLWLCPSVLRLLKRRFASRWKSPSVRLEPHGGKLQNCLAYILHWITSIVSIVMVRKGGYVFLLANHMYH